MAIQINGINIFSLCEPSDFTAETVALGDAPMGNIGNVTGFDGTGTVFLNNFTSPITAGNVYTARTSVSLPSVDISQLGQALLVHARIRTKNYDVLSTDSQALHLIAFSGGSAANWGVWFVDDPYNNGFRDASWKIFRMYGTPDQSGGAFDNSNITGFGFGYKSRITSTTATSAVNVLLERCYHIDNPIFSDTNSDPTTIDDFVNALGSDINNTYPSLLVKKLGATREFAFPFTVSARNFSMLPSATGIAFYEDDLMYSESASGFDYIKFKPVIGGSQSVLNTQFVKGVGRYDFDVDSSAAGSSINFGSSLVTGANNVYIGGSSDLTADGVNITGANSISVADAYLNISAIGCNTPLTIDGYLASNSTINIQNPITEALSINIDKLNFTDLELKLPQGGEINLNPISDNVIYDFTTLTASAPIVIDNNTDNNIIARFNSGVIASPKTPSTGGGDVVISTPLLSLSNPNWIEGSRVVVINYDKSTIVDGIIVEPVVIDNSVVSGGLGYVKEVDLSNPSILELQDTLLFKVNWQSGTTAKIPLRIFAVMTESGISLITPQEDDEIHNNMVFNGVVGLDGSLVDSSNGGELTANLTNVEININDDDNVFDCRRGIAWWRWINTTEQGAVIYDALGLTYNPDEYNILLEGRLKIKNAKVDSELTVINGVWKHYQGESIISEDSNTVVWVPNDRLYNSNESQITDIKILVDQYLDATISSRSTLTAQDVWDYTTRTLSSFSSLVSDIWNNVTRTLTVGSPTVTEIQDGLAKSVEIQSLNDFDPSTDVVATVTTVTNMRGTDNALLDANYTAPDNSTILNVQSSVLEIIANHNNPTYYFGQDGVTRVLQKDAYFISLRSADGTTELRRITPLDATNTPTILSEHTGYS